MKIPQLYTRNDTKLLFENVTLHIGLFCLSISVLLGLFIAILSHLYLSDVRFINSETKAIIINESEKEKRFSPEKLKAYILELNIRFPYIVYAQGRLETGNFRSNLFKQNNNLFAMKIATRRPTTNKGEENGYAYYTSWHESVVDYAFFSAQYLSDIKTEAQYFEYLKQNYAEDTSYVSRLKVIIAEENSKRKR